VWMLARRANGLPALGRTERAMTPETPELTGPSGLTRW